MRTLTNLYRVVVDMIGKNVAKVTSVTPQDKKDAVEYINRTRAFFAKQYKGFGFVDMNAAIQYEFSRNHFKTPNESLMRYKLLRNTKSVHFLTYDYKDVRNEVYTALGGENEVFIHSPYKKPNRTVEVKTAEQWAAMLVDEKAQKRDWAISEAIKEEIAMVLSERTQWLGYPTLQQLHDKFNNTEVFMEYVTSVVEQINSEGLWDYTLPETEYVVDANNIYYTTDKPVRNEEGVANTFTGTRKLVANGSHTGKTFKCKKVSNKDILIEFLTLTFYKAVGMKPMEKVVEVQSCEQGYIEYVPQSQLDEGVVGMFDEEPELYSKLNDIRTTPIYVTQPEELRCFYNKKMNAYNIGVRYNLPEVQ